MTSNVEAAIDIGSNTVHLLVASSEGLALRIHFEDVSRLQLGKDVAETGAISRRKARLVAETVRGFGRRAQKLGARRVHVLATQAIRKADNGAEVVAAVEHASGLRVDVLEPRVESHLAALGAELGHPAWGQSQWVADIGGASTQVGLIQCGRLSSYGSFPIGSLHLNRSRPGSGVSQFVGPMAEFRKDLRSLQDAHATANWTIVGGAARRLARFLERRRLPAELTTDDIEAALEALESRSAAREMRAHGLNPDQLPVVRAGATILAELLHEATTTRCTVSPFGIREGAIRLAASQHPSLRLASEFPSLRAGDAWERRLLPARMPARSASV